MNEDQEVVVNRFFVEKVRLMLVQLAMTEKRPPFERFEAIERSRQACEGFLGIKREELAEIGPELVESVLKMTGHIK